MTHEHAWTPLGKGRQCRACGVSEFVTTEADFEAIAAARAADARDRPLHYVLDGHEPRPIEDIREWAQAFENAGTGSVGADTVGESRVSTAFLGLDYAFGDGPPILFETMIFGGPHEGAQWRYSTWDEAEAGHRRVVEALRAGRDPAAE